MKRPKLDVAVIEHPDIDSLEHLWTELETRSDPSYFQSWGWIGCWLRALPDETRPSAVIAHDDFGKVVGLGLLGGHRYFRHGLVPTRGMYLSQTGDARFDSLTIEYNGLLAERGSLTDLADACVSFLIDHRPNWDELFLPGMDPIQCDAFESASRDRLFYRALYDKPCPFVDLEAVRAEGYLQAISQNTRYQIRRALRLYEKRGPVVYETARSVDEALLFLDGLKNYHQTYWTGRGQPGSFANTFFEQFHRRLITERFDASEIELARISSPAEVIGYLYNFIYRGCVYAYQSGFHYGADGKCKPGLVSHSLAIDHHLRNGAHIYDFMAGEGQHKKSLATHTRTLIWSAAQRRLLKFRVENSLRHWLVVRHGSRTSSAGSKGAATAARHDDQQQRKHLGPADAESTGKRDKD